jgi:hypothetical protein
MADAVIAEIARRTAIAAAVVGYERSPDAKKQFQIVLTELCTAVKAERSEEEPKDVKPA